MTSVLALVALGATGCASRTGEGALIGGASGAAIGAGIGGLSHQRAGEGALLGGIIGAVGGGLIGNEMDRQERDYGYYGDDHGPRYGYAEYSYERYERPRVYRHYHYRYRPSRHGHWHHHHGRRGHRYYERVYCD